MERFMSAALRPAFDMRELMDPAPAGDERFKLARLLELRAVIDTLRSYGNNDLLNEALLQRCAPDQS
jgi:hypothetical protein